MKVKVVYENGYRAAMFGIGLSYGITSPYEDVREIPGSDISRIHNIAVGLVEKGHAEDKFLRQIHVTLDIDAPRFWWSEADTYKVATTAQSESTMHTIKRARLTPDDFSADTNELIIDYVNALIERGADIHEIKANLPEGFYQRRIWSGSYANLRNMISQRSKHRLPEWKIFCESVLRQVAYPDLLCNDKEYLAMLGRE